MGQDRWFPTGTVRSTLSHGVDKRKCTEKCECIMSAHVHGATSGQRADFSSKQKVLEDSLGPSKTK